jgi:hypothetical protein
MIWLMPGEFCSLRDNFEEKSFDGTAMDVKSHAARLDGCEKMAEFKLVVQARLFRRDPHNTFRLIMAYVEF